MDVVIRKALPNEAEEVIDVGIEAWNTTYENLIPRDVIDKLQFKDQARIDRTADNIKVNNNTFIAVVDDKIVGFNTFGDTKDETYNEAGEIYASYILKDYQGLGIGRKLAIACMEEMLNKGYTTLITKCLVGNPSNAFHKSLGGVYVGQTPYEPLGIFVGMENTYYHDDLSKTLEYNKQKLHK